LPHCESPGRAVLIFLSPRFRRVIRREGIWP
jgi:hypothetical protein